jgi:anti-sigma28 factor (negative regulator of flagellin synthesis)
MTVPDKCHRPPGADPTQREDPAVRARRIEDLKRRVQSGTYLIQRYEIIEGLLDALSADTD